MKSFINLATHEDYALSVLFKNKIEAD